MKKDFVILGLCNHVFNFSYIVVYVHFTTDIAVFRILFFIFFSIRRVMREGMNVFPEQINTDAAAAAAGCTVIHLRSVLLLLYSKYFIYSSRRAPFLVLFLFTLSFGESVTRGNGKE